MASNLRGSYHMIAAKSTLVRLLAPFLSSTHHVLCWHLLCLILWLLSHHICSYWHLLWASCLVLTSPLAPLCLLVILSSPALAPPLPHSPLLLPQTRTPTQLSHDWYWLMLPYFLSFFLLPQLSRDCYYHTAHWY